MEPVARRVTDCCRDHRTGSFGNSHAGNCTEDTSIAEHAAQIEPVARRVTDCCRDHRTGSFGNSHAGDFNCAENAAFALDSSENEPDAIADIVARDHDASGSSSKDAAAGIDYPDAENNSFSRDGTFGEAIADVHASKTTAHPAAPYIADSNGGAGNK